MTGYREYSNFDIALNWIYLFLSAFAILSIAYIGVQQQRIGDQMAHFGHANNETLSRIDRRLEQYMQAPKAGAEHRP